MPTTSASLPSSEERSYRSSQRVSGSMHQPTLPHLLKANRDPASQALQLKCLLTLNTFPACSQAHRSSSFKSTDRQSSTEIRDDDKQLLTISIETYTVSRLRVLKRIVTLLQSNSILAERRPQVHVGEPRRHEEGRRRRTNEIKRIQYTTDTSTSPSHDPERHLPLANHPFEPKTPMTDAAAAAAASPPTTSTCNESISKSTSRMVPLPLRYRYLSLSQRDVLQVETFLDSRVLVVKLWSLSTRS
ncbi:hypothetical protein R3P38DRAFT_3215644 [Favolaschia claudopus]|uniref:Uncharacterized protein n=1 Tax=Favolaschia claudopus TaxID=2862362 RepID=A0AAW0A9Y7_9AGAR